MNERDRSIPPADPPPLPRVLVLLATRNGADWIGKQLDSVLRQEGVNLQVDVRDDASSDDTRAIVAARSNQDPRIRLDPDHEGSGSASGNFFRLIGAARPGWGEYVAFCDQDDEWFSDKLQRAISLMTASGADGYSAAVLARWPDGREKLILQNRRKRDADYLFEGAGQGCTFVITARLFEQLRAALGRGDSTAPKLHYHDWLVYAIARARKLNWIFDERPSMIYRQHAANDTGARNSFAGVARRLALIREGWYRGQVDALVAYLESVGAGSVHTARWRVLSAQRGLIGAARRLLFVARYGRRRLSDRAIQLIAILCGWL